MAASRLNPTLFDKLVADLEIEGLRENENERRRMADLGGSVMRFYTVPRIERFNEAALRTTVFLTTHYLAEAETADAVCVLVKGRIIERGSPAEVKARQLSATLEDAYLQLVERS